MSTQQSRRPIRIGNCSGAIGDGIDQLYRLAQCGVDAITADYLAEFNLAWKAIELAANPHLGYEPGFLGHLAWHNGDAARLIAKNKIKVVHNGGALNPAGLAAKVDGYLRSLGIEDLKVAWVTGDNVTAALKNDPQLAKSITHLDKAGQTLASEAGEILSANIYTGQAGIVRALQEGADIVICGRCTDASPVMGLASWWHGWAGSNHDALAGSLMAGHLIECGGYVTGGNYCGQREIGLAGMERCGYPIAEISADGSSIITKGEGNGAVTVDTCKSQLLYEIQGPYYLNPDVVGDISTVRLEQVGKNKVRLFGAKGSPPPRLAKLAVMLLGGYQAEISVFCVGLDTDFKFDVIKRQVLGRMDQSQFTTISIERYGSSNENPRSQKECTVQIRMMVQAKTKEAIEHFRQAHFYNGLQGFCGLHVSMDWRTMEPRQYVKYFPGWIPQSKAPLEVHFVRGGRRGIKVEAKKEAECADGVPKQPNYEPEVCLKTGKDLGETVTRPFGDLVFARSGDKGGNANVGFWVRDARAWPWLRSFLTSRKLIELLANDWSEEYGVERCEFKHLSAVHFVVKGILQDGVSSSSVLDGFAKSFGEFLRARHVSMPKALVEEEQARRRKLQQEVARL